MGQHDLSYRRFFAHRRMIEDLLREIVGEQWVDRIDLETGERVNTSFVSPRHAGRESDVIWKFSRRDGGDEPVYVYILMEFQSRPDPSMPVRLMGYVHNFYEDLMARQPASGWRKLPLVIPVVVYNGTEPWHVAEDLGEMVVDLDPSAEIYRPRLRYRLINELSYSREELEGSLVGDPGQRPATARDRPSDRRLVATGVRGVVGQSDPAASRYAGRGGRPHRADPGGV